VSTAEQQTELGAAAQPAESDGQLGLDSSLDHRVDSTRATSNVDIIILALNEAMNIRAALESVVGWADRVFVVDAGSTDGTIEIAKELGATVVHRSWLGYAAQKNWALERLPLGAEWVFILDSDESITPELRDEILGFSNRPLDEVEEDGFYVNRLTYFLGKPLRHCGYFPSWNLRFFKRGRAKYEDRQVHEHMIVEGQTGRLRHLMLHKDNRGLEHFIAKHNRYSTLEAMELIRDRMLNNQGRARRLEKSVAWRRWMKYHAQPRLPFVFVWRFFYMYVIRLGVLDGATGFRFCILLSMYDFFISLKLIELRRAGAHRNEEVPDPQPAPLARRAEGLAVPEGEPGDRAEAEDRLHRNRTRESLLAAQLGQHTPESSPWTLKQKIMRAMWMLTGQQIFRLSFHNWYGFRSALLRLFGARIGKDVRLRPTVHIEIPWNVRLSSGVTVGDHAILYSLGPISVGARTIISQYAHLCAGSHDYTDRHFPLLRPPVTIGEDAWIGADAFVGPGVEVGRLSVLGARSSAYRSLEPGMVYVGNPAVAIKERKLK